MSLPQKLTYKSVCSSFFGFHCCVLFCQNEFIKKSIVYFVFALLLPSFVMAQVVVTTPSYIFNITYEDAQDAIGKALTEKLLSDAIVVEKIKGQSVAAVINGKKSAPLYSSNKPINVEIRGLRVESAANRWSASMIIMADDDSVVSALPLAGRYMVMNEVPVLKRSLRNGDVISESDIEIKSFPQERANSDIVKDIVDLIDRTPIHTVSSNRPIRSMELSAPSIIKKNALVQMRYKTSTMEITTTGMALQDGAKGDVIEVRNTTSKKIVRSVITDSNIVDVIAQGIAQGAQTSQMKVQ